MKAKDIKVVIGANFGDEGKGLMTDYFCRKNTNNKVLNVRFNGGAQAGHTVVEPNGNRHVFKTIGAGSFNSKVDTYLSERFIVNPFVLREEIETFENKFNKKVKVYIHPNCIVTTPFDMLINQLIESKRSGSRHGSCGYGIFETIKRNEDTEYSFEIKQTLDCINNRDFKQLLLRIRREYLSDRLEELNIESVEEDIKQIIESNYLLDNYLTDLQWVLDRCEIKDESILSEYDYIVFEGAQGLLLDRDNEAYFPHLTPSNTGLKNVMLTLKKCKFEYNMEVCYVTRSYLTRHGNGTLHTECKQSDLGDGVVEKTNSTNEYQGNFRFGYLDTELLINSINNDLNYCEDKEIKLSLAVTHLDQTNSMLITRNGEQKVSLEGTLYKSYGETFKDVKVEC